MRSGNQKILGPLRERSKKWFFSCHLGGGQTVKRKSRRAYTGEDEGGQARVTRRIEYLRGTPFAWKIERCSSIKGASYTRRKITKPRKEFVRRFCCSLSLSLSLFHHQLQFQIVWSSIKTNNFSSVDPCGTEGGNK